MAKLICYYYNSTRTLMLIHIPPESPCERQSLRVRTGRFWSGPAAVVHYLGTWVGGPVGTCTPRAGATYRLAW